MGLGGERRAGQGECELTTKAGSVWHGQSRSTLHGEGHLLHTEQGVSGPSKECSVRAWSLFKVKERDWPTRWPPLTTGANKMAWRSFARGLYRALTLTTSCHNAKEQNT